MKKFLPIVLLMILGVATIYYLNQESSKETLSEKKMSFDPKPDDWLYNQRAYPHNHIDIDAYRAAVQQRKQATTSLAPLDNEQWKLVGPLNTGGRITDIELHPTDQNIIYASTGVGGIFKTIDGGQSWNPIFDNANTPSVGNMAMAPSNPNTIYVGTGEANGSATSGAFFGDGVYKTTNGGQTWSRMGLENSQHIGRIAVDPQNEDRAYVAAAGLLYGKSEDRGIYRTENGGTTWDQVLYISDSTSMIDVVVNPQNANVVFAASWERTRYPWGRVYGGPTSGVHRSTDGGNTWEKLSSGLPVSDENTGRIGLYIAPSDPNIMYACYTTNFITNEFDKIYKSVNGGDNWFAINEDIDDVFRTFGWYFGNIRVNPSDPNDVTVLGVDMMRSNDGGLSFNWFTGDLHVDFHALEFFPGNPDRMVLGGDGGVYISNNSGASWEHMENIPNTQFYTCEVDEMNPTRYYGGTQDNNTIRTMTGSTDDFRAILGGDGFYVNVDPTDNQYVYAEFQWGNLYRSTEGGDFMEWALWGIDEDDRTNWNTPVVLDRSNPSVMYYGSNRVYQSTNRAEFWTPISPDLTKGQHPSGSLAFGSLTTIDVSLTNGQVIYAGSDDGNVQVTMNGGLNWNNITAGLPDRTVSRVAVDPVDPMTAYVTHSGYRYVDYIPHVHKTTDGGQTWIDISGNLPEVPVNDIIVDPEIDGTLYLANDVGVWITFDEGENWFLMGDNLPLTVVADLRLHNPTRKLIAGTFGRSMYEYDLAGISTSLKDQAEAINNLKVFPNPVQTHASIEFDLPKAGTGVIQLLDLQGRVVRQIENSNYIVGKNTVSWNANDLSTGNYIVRLQTLESIQTEKIQVVK